MMDDEAIQRLRRLPDDLASRGWMLLPEELDRQTVALKTRYITVYMRRAEYDQSRQMKVIRVSTRQDHSTSWVDALICNQ